MIELRPITQADAFAFVRAHHRHHGVPAGALWWHAVHDEDGVVRGVAIVGRPIARMLDDGFTVEVTRLCTDGAFNACSMLYGAARRTALAKGYRRGITYILSEESGGSLKASGWEKLWEAKGGSWSRPSRHREDVSPTCPKTAFGFGAWKEAA